MPEIRTPGVDSAQLHDGSVTKWVHLAKAGDEEATRKLWDRYFRQVALVARRRLSHSNGLFDEEDVALSTFDGVIRALKDDRLDPPNDRFEFWGLLRQSARRRVNDRLKVEGAAKRGGGRGNPERNPRKLQLGIDPDQLSGQLDDPQFTAAMSEECKLLLESLRDEELEKVVIWKLEGRTNDEIAEALGYSKRTIQRMVGNIREVWARIRAPLHD